MEQLSLMNFNDAIEIFDEFEYEKKIKEKTSKNIYVIAKLFEGIVLKR